MKGILFHTAIFSGRIAKSSSENPKEKTALKATAKKKSPATEAKDNPERSFMHTNTVSGTKDTNTQNICFFDNNFGGVRVHVLQKIYCTKEKN